MKKSILMALAASVLFAQTGRVYIPSRTETVEAKAAYAKVVAARAVLQDAESEWTLTKQKIAVAHGLHKDAYIDFNAEFTTFDLGVSYFNCNNCGSVITTR